MKREEHKGPLVGTQTPAAPANKAAAEEGPGATKCSQVPFVTHSGSIKIIFDSNKLGKTSASKILKSQRSGTGKVVDISYLIICKYFIIYLDVITQFYATFMEIYYFLTLFFFPSFCSI